MLQVGETLAGYRIEAIIGVGGMAVVYRATQLSLDRAIALKVLSTTLVGNRAFRERFRLEGRHAAALEHPNIIPVYEAGESNGLMFIAMRLVEGATLAELTLGDGISGRETLRILTAVASALDAAHSAGLTHRDVKPQNILVTSAGHPYLADFGVTKGPDHAGLTRTGDFVGSLSCVAPEQIDGRDVTPAADVYALAAVLFHCLTGTHPYQRDTDAALMHAHLHAPPPTFADIGVEVPEQLDAVFRLGMAKDPAERPAQASLLLARCAAVLQAIEPSVLDRVPALPPAHAEPEPAPPVPPAAATPPAPAPAVVRPTPPAAPPLAAATAADRRQHEPAPKSRKRVAARPARAGRPARPPRREPRRRPAPRRPRDRQPPRSGPPSRRWLIVPALVAGALLALAGYSIGRTSPPPKPRTAATAGLQLAYGGDWTHSARASAIAGLPLDDAVTLRGPDGTALTAGRLRAPAPGFDPVPTALAERFTNASPARLVRWDDHRAAAIHVARLRPDGRLWMALLPDSKGWIALACEARTADPGAACRQIAATLQVRGAQPVALGPARAVAAAIGAAVESLGAAVRRERPRLSAADASVRAAAARRLADRCAAAARTLRRVAVRPQERPLVVRLTTALDAQASTLRRLGRAADRDERAAYEAARAAVRGGERRIDDALNDLATAGYRIS